jgi:nickel-dependent lactate racemase
MEINGLLGYGRGSASFAFDEERYEILAAEASDQRPFTDPEIGAALDSPIESRSIEEIVSPGESILLVVSDATRATASAQIINLLVRRLIQNGSPPHDIAIIFATGIHRPVTLAEKSELLTPFIVQRIKTIDHNAYDSQTMVSLGMTTLGTTVTVNRALKDYQHVIITGAIGFHYFAGFTGGRKSICPGLAAAQTIEATHMLALDFQRGGCRQGVGAGLLAGNAVHEECQRIAELIRPSFSINSVVDERGRAVRIYAGHWRAAHTRGCREYLQNHSVRISGKRDVVIVSCGGFPWDINLIQAHKALDMAAHACREGGTIVFLAQCSDGLGRPDFLKWFEEKDSSALEARLRESYEVNGQTAWSLLTKAERFRIYLVSELADPDVRRMRMTPAGTLNQALSDIAGRVEGFIVPRGAALLAVSKD